MTKNNPAPVPETANPSVVENTTDTTTKIAKVKNSKSNKGEKPSKPQFNWAKGFETVATQEKSHSYKSDLLTIEMVKQIKPNMDLVFKAILSGTAHDKNIATHLYKIHGQLLDTATVKYKGNKKLISKNVKSAIKELAERDFRLKSSRAFEYIRLVHNDDVFKLDLSISHLIELSRLKKADDLKNLLAVKTVKDLGAMKFAEIQAVVKEFNSFKRKSKTVKVEKAPVSVSEFKKFIDGFDKVQQTFNEKTLGANDLTKIKSIAEWANKIINSHSKKVA